MLLPEILRIPTWGATGKLGPLLGSQSFLIKGFKNKLKAQIKGRFISI